VETVDEELARLRANAAASLVTPAPPEGEQVAALSSMVRNLFVAECARNNDVHLQQAKECERGLQRQSDLTALREHHETAGSILSNFQLQNSVFD
jgi:hypothetical protein